MWYVVVVDVSNCTNKPTCVNGCLHGDQCFYTDVSIEPAGLTAGYMPGGRDQCKNNKAYSGVDTHPAYKYVWCPTPGTPEDIDPCSASERAQFDKCDPDGVCTDGQKNGCCINLNTYPTNIADVTDQAPTEEACNTMGGKLTGIGMQSTKWCPALPCMQ